MWKKVENQSIKYVNLQNNKTSIDSISGIKTQYSSLKFRNETAINSLCDDVFYNIVTMTTILNSSYVK
jgi:hypothetical protein